MNYCTNCGSKLEPNSKFCVKCGQQTQPEDDSKKVKTWSRKKGFVLILLSVIVTSFVWIFIATIDSETKEKQTVNLLVYSFETIGRQKQAWGNAEQLAQIIITAMSDECINDATCFDDALSQITTLRTTIDKESVEIENLWLTGTVEEDFQSFYSNVTPENQLKIDRVLEIYFPEEIDELEKTSVELL